MYFVLVKMKRTNKYWKPWMFVYFAVLTYLFRYSILDSKFASVFFQRDKGNENFSCVCSEFQRLITETELVLVWSSCDGVQLTICLCGLVYHYSEPTSHIIRMQSFQLPPPYSGLICSEPRSSTCTSPPWDVKATQVSHQPPRLSSHQFFPHSY